MKAKQEDGKSSKRKYIPAKFRNMLIFYNTVIS